MKWNTVVLVGKGQRYLCQRPDVDYGVLEADNELQKISVRRSGND